MEVESILDINESRYNDVIEKVCDTEEKCVNNENCYGIYEEHNYVILDSENNNTDVSAENHRKCTWPEMKINQNDYKLHGQEKQGRIKEDSVLCDKAPAADLGKFMIAETLRDMVSTSGYISLYTLLLLDSLIECQVRNVTLPILNYPGSKLHSVMHMVLL